MPILGSFGKLIHFKKFMMSSKINVGLTIFIFLICLGLGIGLSSRRALWNDEIYSQVSAIQRNSYQKIILSGIKGEGNKSPLFYLQQKILCDVFRYQASPDLWKYADGLFEKIFLRLPTVIEISVFLALLFYFFTNRFNLWLGIFGVLIALSSPMLWWYWAEARPYGLWVLLTGAQMLLFIKMIESPLIGQNSWISMFFIHTALVLTSVISIIQITVVSGILLFKNRSWMKFTFLFLIPAGLVLYYKPIGNSHDVIFTLTIDQMLRDCIARDRLYILLFYPVLLILYLLQNKLPKAKFFINNFIVKVFPFFLSVGLMILTTVLFLIYLRRNATNTGQYIVSRHVIFLLPIGMITVTYLTGLVWETLRNQWVRVVIIIAILGLLSYRLSRVWGLIKGAWHIG